jgi:hypothetical protein
MEHLLQNTDILWPKRSPEQNELITALCKAQAEMPIVDKNKSGRFKYADFAHVIFVTRPLLTKYGLAVTQEFMATRDGANFIITTLAHISGQWRESVYALPLRTVDALDKGQTLNAVAGGDITYYKRYTYCAIIGCVTSDEDYDGDPMPLPEKKTAYEPTISQAQIGLLLRELGNDSALLLEIFKKEAIADLKELPKTKFNAWLERVRVSKSAVPF